MAPILLRNYSDLSPPTQLTNTIGTTDTSWQVASTAGYPPVPFTLGADRGTSNQEVCLCTSVPDSSHFVVQRAYDGTQAFSHEATAVIELVICSLDYREANLHHTDTTRDDHFQYLNLVRHGNPGIHLPSTATGGGNISVGGPTNSNPGDIASVGLNTDIAFSLSTHVHGREEAVEGLPVGVMLDYAGNTPPGGDYVLCDGSAYSRQVYNALWTTIGTQYGAGDGATTFNVPNCQGRVTIGAGSGNGGSISSRIVGAVGGEEFHLLTQDELTYHSHAMLDFGHAHNSIDGQNFVIGPNVNNQGQNKNSHLVGDGALVTVGNFEYNVPTTALAATGMAQTGTQGSGGGLSHNNMQPFLVCTKIIKIM